MNVFFNEIGRELYLFHLKKYSLCTPPSIENHKACTPSPLLTPQPSNRDTRVSRQSPPVIRPCMVMGWGGNYTLLLVEVGPGGIF